MKVRAWPIAGAVFAVVWLFVRGVALSPAAVLGQFLFGLAVGLPVAFVFRRLYARRIHLGRAVLAIPYAGLYVGSFAIEIVRANFDVAYRVLAPDPPVEPEVILIPLRVRSDLSVTIIANSITITPGTVTFDHDPEANALYVHAIDGRDPEAIAAPIHRWEDYALSIFDEASSPDDPPPEIRVGRKDEDRRVDVSRDPDPRGEDGE